MYRWEDHLHLTNGRMHSNDAAAHQNQYLLPYRIRYCRALDNVLFTLIAPSASGSRALDA